MVRYSYKIGEAKVTMTDFRNARLKQVECFLSNLLKHARPFTSGFVHLTTLYTFVTRAFTARIFEDS
jgi:hypothetical protein